MSNIFPSRHKNSVGLVQVMKYGGNALRAAQTLAHEMGHNLGLKHDEDDESCTCDGSQCIMNKTLG